MHEFHWVLTNLETVLENLLNLYSAAYLKFYIFDTYLFFLESFTNIYSSYF